VARRLETSCPTCIEIGNAAYLAGAVFMVGQDLEGGLKAAGAGFSAAIRPPAFLQDSANDEEAMIAASQVFHHYTNEAGYKSIDTSRMILPNTSGKVFVTELSLNPSQAFNQLFIGAATHAGRGDYVFPFTAKQGVTFESGKRDELFYLGTLRFDRHVEVVYSGPNLNP
jgi:hypothetical protein